MTRFPLSTRLSARRSLRPWFALALLTVAWWSEAPAQSAVFHEIAHGWGLHVVVDGTLMLVPYGVLMGVRLAWNALIVAAVMAILGGGSAFPLKSPRGAWFTGVGLITGNLVMSGVILLIWGLGAATLSGPAQSFLPAIRSLGGWLAFDGIGALGEELWGRVAVLIVAERFVGRRGAVLVSGAAFLAIHLGNPGADAIWLFRLACQGMLLAYSVYRTRSVWWAVGYHTGWNWASAPLFGAAGSGYLDQGHLFAFAPTGAALVTGGAVGPEGSLLAFAAMAAALAILMAVTRNGQRSPSATTAPGHYQS